jgi:hypothetical protein
MFHRQTLTGKHLHHYHQDADIHKYMYIHIYRHIYIIYIYIKQNIYRYKIHFSFINTHTLFLKPAIEYKKL